MEIEQLPNDIMLMIFRYIDDHRQRARLELVCHRWRQIMKVHGWKHVRRIQLEESRGALWIEPLGQRCGDRLVECRFFRVHFNSTMIRLITEQFPALKNLDFISCTLRELDENALEQFREFGTRLHSLTFFHTGGNYYNQLNNHLLPHFTRLRHLGLGLPYNSLPTQLSSDLRSMHLSCSTMAQFGPGLAQMLILALKDSPKLAALYLDSVLGSNFRRFQEQLSRISDLKNLRFLRIALHRSADIDLLCSCLDNLPNLLALQMDLSIQQKEQLTDLFRTRAFRGLVHLSLSIVAQSSDVYEPIGLLSTLAPQLRSLSLDNRAHWLDVTQGIGSELLKIAKNGQLEYLNLPCLKPNVDLLGQLIQLSPNLHLICGLQWRWQKHLSQLTELRQVVVDQWKAGTRKHLPLRVWLKIWIYDHAFASWPDPYLHIDRFPNVPPNPVLNKLFRDEVFNDGEGTPTFVTEHCSSKA